MFLPDPNHVTQKAQAQGLVFSGLMFEEQVKVCFGGRVEERRMEEEITLGMGQMRINEGPWQQGKPGPVDGLDDGSWELGFDEGSGGGWMSEGCLEEFVVRLMDRFLVHGNDKRFHMGLHLKGHLVTAET